MRSLGNPFGFIYIFKSSIWIIVFIARVGCIFEAAAHPVNSNTNSDLGSGISPHSSLEEITFPLKKRLTAPTTKVHRYFTSAARSLKSGEVDENDTSLSSLETSSLGTEISGTKSLHADDVEDVDSCVGKKDGYYPNLGSGCTSYYYCAAGYQITYVCSPRTFYNGDKCVGNYKCPSSSVPIINPCLNLANGYYPMKQNAQKYFYCFHKAKVIELSCGEGKFFSKTEKSCMNMATSAATPSLQSNLVVDKIHGNSCTNKPNGFYTIVNSGCRKYYYCIQDEKTELECQPNYVFNGNICVVESRFSCPTDDLN